MIPQEEIIVPSSDAPINHIWAFAHTYNAYDRHDGMDGASAIGNDMRDRWNEGQPLSDELNQCRAALFFEARRWRHYGYDPDGRDLTYIRTLVGHIAVLSGGAVPGPSDDLP
ncbi:hypothetical protein ACE2AJ_00455 [Aquihabitans daechungensis]|uniref:hypothetical protein n=1 Tax=Aquihabitans daechungensis TaxID=1052257 RepID=UPI003B9FC215